MTRSDLETRANERARYIEATTDLSSSEADAVAYSELGHSESGIATRIDSTASTVSTYLDRVVAQYGPEAAHAKRPSELARERDLSEVDRDQIASWPQHYRETWQQAVERHPDRSPLQAAITEDALGDETTVREGSA
jgi:hypothetical protein